MIVPFLFGVGFVLSIVMIAAPQRQRAAWELLCAVVFTALAPLTAVEGDGSGCCIAVLCALLAWALWVLGRVGIW